MRVTTTTDAAARAAADTVVVGLLEGKGIPHDTAAGDLQRLVDSGEAKPSPRHLAVTHADGRRWIVVGLGRRDDLDAERARGAGAAVVGRARELGTRALCWEVPHHAGDDVVAGLVEGTVLAAYRFDRYKRSAGDTDAGGESDGGARLDELVLSDHADRAVPAARAATVAEA